MNRYKLSKAGISATEGIARFNGSVETYEEMLRMFLQETHYAELVRAIGAQDAAAAFRAGHSLKGMAGNLSMNRLLQDITPLVEELRGGKFDRAEKLLAPVTADYEAVKTVLTEMQVIV